MVVEELDTGSAADLVEENEDLAKRLGGPVTSQAWRYSFFTKRFSSRRALASVSNEHFLGYTIIKKDTDSSGALSTCVYESVLIPSRHANNFVRGSQMWTCRVGERSFTINGYLYAQQNGKTNCCAHVACRTAAARYHPDGDMTYREMNSLPEIGIDHVTTIADDGLSSEKMVAVLKAAGAQCFVAKYTKVSPDLTPPPFQKWLYGSIESGYPAILFFETSAHDFHTIPVFGHTFNQDMWVANAELSYFRVGAGTVYVPSEQWLSTFLAHDDNWGSNYCIPRHFLYANPICDRLRGKPRACEKQPNCVAYVIATFPQDVKVNSIAAEVIGADYLFRLLPQLPELNLVWGRRLQSYANQNLLVLRPILIDARRYADHLALLADWQGGSVQREVITLLREMQGLGNIWMVELSVPELFAINRRKLGEVLILADIFPSAERDFRNYLLARVPGYFGFCVGGDATSPEFLFQPSGIRGHVALFGCEDETA